MSFARRNQGGGARTSKCQDMLGNQKPSINNRCTQKSQKTPVSCLHTTRKPEFSECLHPGMSFPRALVFRFLKICLHVDRKAEPQREKPSASVGTRPKTKLSWSDPLAEEKKKKQACPALKNQKTCMNEVLCKDGSRNTERKIRFSSLRVWRVFWLTSFPSQPHTLLPLPVMFYSVSLPPPAPHRANCGF